jgi:hypothetical protein
VSPCWARDCCAGLPRVLRAIDVASLRSACRISLGRSRRYEGVLDFGGELWAEISDCNFVPTSSHADFLKLFLPEWCEGIEAAGWDHVWERATAVLQQSTFDDYAEWTSKGLFWDMEEGFIFRALRCAIATLRAWGSHIDDIPQFAQQCLTFQHTVESRIDDLAWRVRLDRMCDFDAVTFEVDSFGQVVNPIRTRRGDYKAISFTQTTGVNDGLHIVAALADYHFWWAIRLFDWVSAGHSERPVQDLLVAIYCARAGLAEVMDLAGLLVHEFSHTTGVPATWWECQFLTDNLDCCHFMLAWNFEHRMLAEFGLPLPLMADCSTSQSFPDEGRDRFDYADGEAWSFTFAFDAGAGDHIDKCDPASFTGAHADLWTLRHRLDVSWDYPSECAAQGSDSSGSDTFNGPAPSGTSSVYCLKHPEECADRAERDRPVRL